MPHTPGPWRVHSEHADRIIVNGCCVYEVNNLVSPEWWEADHHGEAATADVRLMAAAPELLAALKLCWEITEEADCLGIRPEFSVDQIRIIEAALAKAEGRE